jgi:hypothetical protein
MIQQPRPQYLPRDDPDQGTHYLVDGFPYVRVSTITNMIRKESLEQWRGSVGNEAADERMHLGATFGRRLHAGFQAFATNPTAGHWAPSLDPDLEPFAEAFLGWWHSHVARVIGAELFLVSHQHGYAGTADLVARLTEGRGLAIVDWKSGSAHPRGNPAPDPAWRLQLAAYAEAYAESHGEYPARRLVVQTPRTQPGSLYVHEFAAAHQARDFGAFRAYLHCYHWQREVER